MVDWRVKGKRALAEIDEREKFSIVCSCCTFAVLDSTSAVCSDSEAEVGLFWSVVSAHRNGSAIGEDEAQGGVDS